MNTLAVYIAPDLSRKNESPSIVKPVTLEENPLAQSLGVWYQRHSLLFLLLHLVLLSVLIQHSQLTWNGFYIL